MNKRYGKAIIDVQTWTTVVIMRGSGGRRGHRGINGDGKNKKFK